MPFLVYMPQSDRSTTSCGGDAFSFCVVRCLSVVSRIWEASTFHLLMLTVSPTVCDQFVPSRFADFCALSNITNTFFFPVARARPHVSPPRKQLKERAWSAEHFKHCCISKCQHCGDDNS